MTEENYGKLLIDSGYLTIHNEPFPMIHYVSGIKKFDEQFNSKEFSETNFCHGMIFYENAIVFYIFNSEIMIKESYSKSSLIEIKLSEKKRVKIRNINSVSKFLKTGAIGGSLVGSLVTTAIGTVSDKLTDKFKGITSKEVDGLIYELYFKFDDGSTNIIKISCIDEYYKDVNKFLVSRNITEPIEKSSACYIATVCYNDNMAPEVVKFREFRDNFLNKYYFGRMFISFYYNNAESLSIKLSRRPLVNALIKNLVLNPIYLVIRIFYR